MSALYHSLVKHVGKPVCLYHAIQRRYYEGFLIDLTPGEAVIRCIDSDGTPGATWHLLLACITHFTADDLETLAAALNYQFYEAEQAQQEAL
jgi:hypothetical protein